MSITKSKKSQAGVRVTDEVITWLILFGLLVFVLLWYSGWGSWLIKLVKSWF